MVFPVHLLRAANVAFVDCPDRSQFIGLRSLKQAAPKSIWFFQEALIIMSFIERLHVALMFCRHNLSNFKARKNFSRKSGVILIEANGLHSSHIAYSYLVNILANKYNAQIKAYFPRRAGSMASKVRHFCESTLNLGRFAIYRSFGANEFVSINLSKSQKTRALSLYAAALVNINSKAKIEDLHLESVWVGDLLYDTYLRLSMLPTIDPLSKKFTSFLLEFVENFVFWYDYFDNNYVCAVTVSHCVYDLALPLRIAVQRNIDAFQANATHVYRLTKKNLFAYNDFFYFRERFSSLPVHVQKAGSALANKRIKSRFEGEVGVDMPYSTKSAFGKFKKRHLLSTSNKTKVLIAAHCFFDSPHSYGKNLFPDFYEWLEFLGVISEKTDYEWYVKTHPDYLKATKKVVCDFVNKFPKFNLLAADASHLQIIDEGIDFALTCYGTIGFEYAALGIPVINASINNPHIAYDFNMHPRSVDEYASLLENLNSIDFRIDRAQVLEYYFMKFIFNSDNLFFGDYHAFINSVGGYHAQFTVAAYSYWLSEWSNKKHKRILDDISRFIDSGDFRMDSRHSRGCIDLNWLGVPS